MGSSRYLKVGVNKKSIYKHTVVAIEKGLITKKNISLVSGNDSPMVCDHINGDKKDNRPSNIRVISRSTNARLQSPNYRIVNGVLMKLCTRCGVIKNLNDFYIVPNKNNPRKVKGEISGHVKHLCKKCHNVRYTTSS